LIRPAGTPTHSSQLFITIASAGFVLTGVVNTFLGPILPILSARWTLSDSRAGHFFATQFFGSIVGVIISSALLPRRGFRFTIGLAYLLMAAGISGLILSEWRYALLGTFALGLGLGFVIPSTNLFISQANQTRRASALSTLNFCWGLGAVSAPVAVFFSARQNHVSTFMAFLSVILILLAISLTFTSEGDLSPHEQKLTEHPSQKTEWRFVAILGCMFFLYVAVESSVGGWIATLAERVPSRAIGTWVLAPSLYWGGLLAGRGIAPLVFRRIRERRVALTGLAIAGAGMCVLVFSSQWQWITAAGLVAGIGLAAIFPITVALLSRFQDMETKNAGPMFALAGLGGATMPWLVGAVSTWSGSLQAGLMVPLLATVTLFWLHAIGNHGSQPASEQPIRSCDHSA
jgi:FHS family glucose/mannose:H+ symporter-like MFS transporter